MRHALVVAALAAAVVNAQQPAAPTPAPAPFRVEETTIAQIHEAMKAGRLTCRALVDAYLKRIDAYDKNGPALNAIVQLNPDAQKQADDMDRRYAQGGPIGPLHCIPAIVKDNFETVGLQSAAGSLSLKGFVSGKDAFQVKRIKDAGAIVLAKSNMAEFAFSPYETVNSILPGYTRNPYALDRVTAGSSGGTAAAVAANLGAIGLGSDTGNSIRGPSSHQALAGIRSTMGLTSRAGVVPLNLLADIAGPMTRTVEDAVTVFQVIAGEDPDDPATAAGRGRTIPDYRQSLQRDGLKGARIGILRQVYERATTDAEIVDVFMAAVEDLKRAGATIVDPVRVDLTAVQRPQGSGSCGGFKYDINRYLAAQGKAVPVHSLEEIIRSRQFHPSIEARLRSSQDGQENGPETPACKADADYREAFRAAVSKAMDENRLDAFVYPTWSNPPRLIGDLNTPHGDNSQVFSPTTGWPAVNVPMGYTRGTLPAGLTIFGRAWSEATLIKYAYAYEQMTHHRHPPASAPPLR
jgi:Asp-tRNA(Asn)/Glu-tRNA(Gln) amidotransferase A subunit family amidase